MFSLWTFLEDFAEGSLLLGFFKHINALFYIGYLQWIFMISFQIIALEFLYEENRRTVDNWEVKWHELNHMVNLIISS